MAFNFNFLKTAEKAVQSGANKAFNFLDHANPIIQPLNGIKTEVTKLNPAIGQKIPTASGIRDFAVGTARGIARVLPTVGTSATEVGSKQAGTAQTKTADQLQALSVDDRKAAINKSPGLKQILTNAGVDINNPVDSEIGKLKSRGQKTASTPVVYHPGNNTLAEAVLGKEPVQSYQARTEGNKKVVEGSRFRGAATPLSILGAGLTIGGDVSGFGGAEKQAVEEGLGQLAKSATEKEVKNLLENKVAPEVLSKVAGAIAKTKDPHIVTNILKGVGVNVDNLFQSGVKNAGVAAAKDVAKTTADHPAVSAVDQHLQALNAERDRLAKLGKGPNSPEVKANTQAYKDALASKNQVISDINTTKAPSVLPTPVEPASRVQQMHQTLDQLDKVDTSQMPADKLAAFNEKKVALRTELNKAEPPAPTVAPSILPGKAISDVGPTATPPGLTQATVPGIDAVKQTPTVAETVAAKLRGSPATKGEAGVAGVSNLQRKQAAINTGERAQRIAAGLKASEGLTGTEALNARKAAYSGSFAKADSKALVESVQKTVTPQESDGIITSLLKHPDLTPHEQLNAAEGWRKFYEEGKLPTPSTSALWDKALGSNFTDSALEHAATVPKGFRAKASEVAGQVAALPKSLMASFDLSGGFRQGAALGVRYPKEFGKALVEQVKYFGSPQHFEEGMKEIGGRANSSIYKRMKIDLTGVKSFAKPEEQFVGGYAESKLAKKLLVGHGVAASDRAYTGMLTKLRADAADHIIANLEKAGIDVNKMSDKELKDIGRFINTASGRGDLGALEKHATTLQTALFSPRLWKSRLDILNPLYYKNLEGGGKFFGASNSARRLALESAASFAGIATAVLSLAALAGAKVGTDPRSSDFGKIKVGNTRYDILGGFQQNIRVAAQIVSGEKINTANGEVQKLSGGFGKNSRWNVLDQFLTNKANPVIGVGRKLLEGKDPAGNPVNPFTTVGNLFVPLTIQDAYQGYKDSGAGGVAKTVPGIFGVGVQNYQINVTNKQKSYIENLKKQGADSKTIQATTEFFQSAKKAPDTTAIHDQIKAAVEAGDQARVVSLVNDYNKKYAEAFKPWVGKYGAQYGTKDLQDFYNRGKITPADLSETVSKIQKDKADKAKGVVKL